MIGVPSRTDVKAEFMMCLMMMFGYELMNGRGVGVRNKRGSILPNLREELVTDAIAADCTHLLFVDSDMMFPPQTLEVLLSHRKDVVACSCAVKALPSQPTAFIAPKEKLFIYPGYEPGLQRVWRVGCGVMLVKLDVIREIAVPRFPLTWRPDVGSFQGEDWGFCELLELHQIPIYVDTELSLEIGHLGDFEYGHKHVEVPDAVKQAYEAHQASQRARQAGQENQVHLRGFRERRDRG